MPDEDPIDDQAGYDAIGDVHGHVDQLRTLLHAMGYKNDRGTWRHHTRTAVFVGDLIDRRRHRQLETLQLVRKMTEENAATVVMGNHEFNAIAYATFDPKRLDYCRAHSLKNDQQHLEFIEEVCFGSRLHRTIIDWFLEFPLWFERDGLRVVHACWSHHDIEHLRGVLTDDIRLTESVVVDGTKEHHRTYKAIENVLKGPELHLGGAYHFDKDGNKRTKARVKWWDPTATTLQTAANLPSDTKLWVGDDKRPHELENRELANDEVPRYTDDLPVVFGHYWFTGTPKVLEDRRAACVDYSAGKGGPLVAYRWSGERRLVKRNFRST